LIGEFHAVADAIAIRISQSRIRAGEIFIAIVHAVAIRIQRGIGSAVRIETVSNLPDVRHAIFIGVTGAGERGEIHQIRLE
jgi:head-tail adaptor